MSIKPHVRVGAALVGLISAVALTGCTTGGGSGSGSGDGTTVTVMWQASEFTPDYVADFEKQHPDITIKFIEYDDTRLNAMLTAGDPPDLVRGSPSANLFARGLATPLDDYVAGSSVIKEDDLEAVNDLWRWDGTTRGTGKLYGIVKDFSPDITFWQNSAVLSAAGVEPFSTTEPTDWDTLLETANKVKAAGVEYPLGIEWQWGIGGVYQTMVEQQDSSIFSDDLTEANVDTPESIRAIQWLIDYGKDGVGPTSLNPLADAQDAPSFLAGKMAMTMDGFWFGGNLAGGDAADTAATSTMIPAPTFGTRVSPAVGGVGGWIPEASKNKDAAWTVMEYFMAGKPAEDRAASGWGLPSLTSLWSMIPSEQPYQQEAIATAKAEMEHFVPLDDSPYISFTQWNGILDQAVQDGIKGTKTAEQVAQDLQDQMNTLLQQGKDQLG